MAPNDHANLHLTVLSPREPAPRVFSFARTETVGDAARVAADAFGYVGGTPTLQNAKGDVLDRAKSLVAEHVHDGDTLEIVDVGGGV